jgi:hypothetical protein
MEEIKSQVEMLQNSINTHSAQIDHLQGINQDLHKDIQYLRQKLKKIKQYVIDKLHT